MFQESGFQEGAELSTTMEEIDGVVSTRSFEMLVQWLCQNRIVFGDLPPAEMIAASIEFARLADMVGLTGVVSMTAEHIRQVILANRPAQDNVYPCVASHPTWRAKMQILHLE
ncbi:hypothetical protein BKA64DRAFT_250384 [Cadophora sp. MPI-SDFR-AT-0126]|nr:hypothetical protein BKA64DRAFT_250384 [Leotiomycetes sp. MPI-SDFR-AT-0126]